MLETESHPRDPVLVKTAGSDPLWFAAGDRLDPAGNLEQAAQAITLQNFSGMKALSAENQATLVDISVAIEIADFEKARGSVSMRPNLQVMPFRVHAFTSIDSFIGRVPGPMGWLEMYKDSYPSFGADFVAGIDDKKHQEGNEYSYDASSSLEVTLHADRARYEAHVGKALRLINACVAKMAAEGR